MDPNLNQVQQDPSVPIEPPAPQKPNPASNTLIVLLVVLSFILFGTTGFLAFQNYQLKIQARNSVGYGLPSPSPSASPDPTADWKTYTNQKYGFYFKYSPEWTANEQTVPNSSIVAMLTKDGNTLQSESSYQIEIEVKNNPKKLDSAGWAEVEAQLVGASSDSLVKRPVEIAGEKTFAYSGQLPRWTQEVVYLPYKDNIFIIRSATNQSDQDDSVALEKVFDQILSTFSFTTK